MAKKNSKIVSVALIVIGAALIAAVGLFTLNALTASEPKSLSEWIVAAIAAIGGVFGVVKNAMDLFKPDKPSAPTYRQTNVGDGNTNVQNVETLNVHLPAPKEVEPHPLFGSVPRLKTEKYISRGNLETDVRAALKQNRAAAIVGVHGMGGLGKSEMAKQISLEAREKSLWVDVNDKNWQSVLAELTRVCDLKLEPNASDEDKLNALHRYFSENQNLLVVFDDVRQNALPDLFNLLPPKLPYAALLTSRIMTLGNMQSFPMDVMTPKQARELLASIVTEEKVKAEEAIAQKIAERVKFNPLALEICARWVWQHKDGARPFARFYERIENRLEALKTEGDPRWNLTAVFDLSYNDLNETDQRRFRQLAVFAPTGFSIQAAAHLWELDKTAAEDMLERFLNLSLVKEVDERYRLHDLLDEYAAGKLRADSEEEEKTETALADWLIKLFGDHYTDDFSNAPQVGLEFANLAKTAEWALEKRKGALLAALATKPRNWLYNYFRELNDWLRWLEGSLKIGVEDNQLKANVLQAIGDVQQFRDDRDAAIESYNEALKLFRQVGAKLGEANVLSSQGQMYLPDNLDKANEILNQALQIYQKIGDGYSIPAQIGNYGWKLYRLGEYEKSKPYLLQAADLFEKMGLMDYAERHRNAVSK
ncbi:MAG: NB-ARC domain-containing protein [Anaerolineales bacterium]|nr:NB-ARC domain-containing protein [Anaerolineales bacterium]